MRESVFPEQYSNYIWNPHHSVIKDDDLTTTKIWPVFNYSLKVRNAPSLNEAVYLGINLLNDSLDLLLYFRSNSHIFMDDIRKAFLMIKSILEVDKNRFFFGGVGFFLGGVLERVKMLCAFDTQCLFLDFWLVHSLKFFYPIPLG